MKFFKKKHVELKIINFELIVLFEYSIFYLHFFREIVINFLMINEKLGSNDILMR